MLRRGGDGTSLICDDATDGVRLRIYAAIDDWTIAKYFFIDNGDGLEGDPSGAGVEHAKRGENKVKQLMRNRKKSVLLSILCFRAAISD